MSTEKKDNVMDNGAVNKSAWFWYNFLINYTFKNTENFLDRMETFSISLVKVSKHDKNIY